MTLPKKDFYFVRHGITDWNIRKICTGQVDIPLAPEGRDQASKAHAIFPSMSINSICYSPLKRTEETAYLIKGDHPCTMYSIPNLKEFYAGSWEGKHQDEIIAIRAEKGENFWPIDSEGEEAFSARAIRGVEEALTYDDPVLIVAHAEIFNALLKHMELPKYEVENCQIVKFSSCDEGWSYSIVGETVAIIE